MLSKTTRNTVNPALLQHIQMNASFPTVRLPLPFPVCQDFFGLPALKGGASPHILSGPPLADATSARANGATGSRSSPDPAGDEPAHRLGGRERPFLRPRSLHYSFVNDTFAPASSLASCAQRKPIQLIFVFGSVPFRMAARMVVVLSIHPPPRNAF